MNKKTLRITGALAAFAMMAGVGAAIGASRKAAVETKAASKGLAFHFQGAGVHGSETSYAARSATVDSATDSVVDEANWQITVGNNSAQLGTNARAANLSKTTLGNGSFSAASGLATALEIETTTQKYSAAICTTAMSNIDQIDLIFTGTNGGNITTAWVLSSTNGTTWEIEATKTSSITSGSSFTFSKNSDARQYAFVSYWNLTNSGGLKDFELKLYGTYDDPQTLTASAESAYTDESITISSDASSTVTWSIVSDAETTASGAGVDSDGVVTVTGPGYVKVKATATGYLDATKKVQFLSRPTSPFITPSKDSTSGYTGQNESLSFSYGNLTSTLNVVSNNTSVVTVGEPSASAGSGTVQINFVGAGSTTVKFYDGATERASVTVSVTASSVTITGLAASDSVYIDDTLDLGSTITVTATGICSSDVTWESEDDSIAEVSASGVVTGVAEGTVDITVTSDDYPSATMTCSVTVSEAPLLYEVSFGTSEGTTGLSDDDWSKGGWTIPTGVTLDNITGNVYGNTTGTGTSLRFGKGGTTGSFDATIADGLYIKKITANLKYYGSDTTAAFDVTPSGGAAISKTMTDSWSNYEYDVSATYTNKVTLGTSISGKRAFLSGFTVLYAKTWTKELLERFTCSGETLEHPDGAITADNPTDLWATLSGWFSELPAAKRASLKTLPADANGSIDEKAMARYDLIIRKYQKQQGIAAYTDFIGRFAAGGANPSGLYQNLGFTENQDMRLPLIIAIVVGGLVAVGGFYFIQRRRSKED